MSFETDADRLDFLQACGRVVTLEDSGASTWSAYGIYSFEYVDVNNVESKMPTIMVRDSDMVNPAGGAAVIKVGIATGIGQGDFDIIGRQPDGHGMTLLIMENE